MNFNEKHILFRSYEGFQYFRHANIQQILRTIDVFNFYGIMLFAIFCKMFRIREDTTIDVS